MYRIFIFFFALVFSCVCASAQVVTVVDYKLAGTITANNLVSMSALVPTSKDIETIRVYQEDIAVKTGIIHTIRNKMYESKFSVSVVVSNGQNIISIGKISKDIAEYQAQMIEYAQNNPELLIIAYKAQANLIERIADLLLHINQSVIQGGDENLLSSKQRIELIRHVIKELRIIRGIAYGVNRRMRLAARVGLIKAINPFGLAYPNRDLQIINKIIDDIK